MIFLFIPVLVGSISLDYIENQHQIKRLDKYIAELAATYNLGENIADKLTNLSKIRFSMECFTADFLRFSSTTFKT